MSCERITTTITQPGGLVTTLTQDAACGSTVLTQIERSQCVTVVGVPGPQGAPGAIRIAGAVATAADLPVGGAAGGDLYITRDDNHGHAWDGAQWIDVGPVQGPSGAKGKDGQIRFTGTGAPGVILGAEPGDTYLDTMTGNIYTLQ